MASPGLRADIEALLRVAPSWVYVFERANPAEVLIATDKGVWLSISKLESLQNRDEYRVLEWGFDSLDDLRDSHFFTPKWELLTWLTDLFTTLPSKQP